MEETGKIRKRGCSSNSSSSLVRNYRFKRAITIRKRVGGTPKMAMVISSVPSEGTELLKFPASSARNERDGVVSARRLAATLWEINDVSSSQSKKESTRVVRSSDPACRTLPEVDGSGLDGWRRKKSAPESQKLEEDIDYLFSNASLLEMEIGNSRPRFRDVCKGLAAAKELLKVLSHIWRLEERHSSSTKSLVSALRAELDGATVQIHQLAHDHRSYRREMKYAIQHLVHEAGSELAAEKRRRRQAERLNKKLGRELAEGKARLDKTVKELESERRAKDVLEQVCDELANGVGDDRAEVEELKRASAEAWEEVEKEREMLRLADVLREERVQMKLAEAKYHFEEKNADIEKLKCELEAYMSNHGIGHNQGDDASECESPPGLANSQELRDFLQKTLGKACQNPNIEGEDGEVDSMKECHEDDDSNSRESDLHSIELEMAGSGPSSGKDDSKRSSSVEVFKGRKSLSEKIQWATISLLKGSSTAAAATAVVQPEDRIFRRRSSTSSSESRGKEQEDETKKHKSVKSLKKQILSSFKLGSNHLGSSNSRPTKQCVLAIERS